MTENPVTRRQFLLSVVKFSALGGLLLGGYVTGIEPNWIRRTHYDLVSPKWPKGYAPLNLAIAADFHVGCPSVNLKRTRNVVERLNALNPDMTLLVGDYLVKGVVGGTYVHPGPIADVLGGLRAKYGVYAVLGNHDWWKDGPGMWDALERNGIRVFENGAMKVRRPDLSGQDLWIAGLADDSTRTPDIPATMAQITDDDPVIMMSHDPAPFLEMTDRPVVTVAGHTHGGQVRVPFMPPVFMAGRGPRRFAYGHIHEKNRDLVVTSGIGTSILPVRFNMLPEIVTMTVRAG